MAKTGGYFLQGLAGGLQSGMNMGQQLQEMQWKKDQQKKLDDKQQKIADGATMFSNLVKQFGADNIYTDDEIMQLNAAYLSSSYDVQAVIKDTNDAIQSMNKSKLEQDYKWLDLYTDWIDGLDPKDVGGIFETVKGQIQSKQGKQVLEAYTNIYNKKYKAKPKAFASPAESQAANPGAGYEYNKDLGGYIPTYQKPITTEPKAAGISDYNGAANYLKNYANSNMSDENFNKIRDGIATKFGLDLSGMTRESLKETSKQENVYYSSGEEAMSNSPDIANMDKEPVMVDVNRWKVNYIRKTKGTGEDITIQDYLFNDTKGYGIISGKDMNALTEQDKIDITNIHNTKKQFLSPEVLQKVEEYLTGFGIDLNPPATSEPKPTPESEVKQPGFFSKFNEKVKAYGKNLQEKFSGTQKDYTTMTIDELYELADKQNDAGAYAELKKRGYIK